MVASQSSPALVRPSVSLSYKDALSISWSKGAIKVFRSEGVGKNGLISFTFHSAASILSGTRPFESS